jgi:hypothetical protein
MKRIKKTNITYREDHDIAIKLKSLPNYSEVIRRGTKRELKKINKKLAMKNGYTGKFDGFVTYKQGKSLFDK